MSAKTNFPKAEVVGTTDDAGRIGVIGSNGGSHAFGSLAGNDPVFGQHAGVYGESDQQGVMGLTTVPKGTGIYGGGTTSAGGDQIGVRGETGTGVGVKGLSNSSGIGVQGISNSGTGVFGQSNRTGVGGQTLSDVDAGVNGRNDGNGFGVFGGSFGGPGVEGHSTNGTGVAGFSENGLAGHFQGNVEVTGNIKTAGNLEVTGSVTTFGSLTASDIFLVNGADCAEDFEIAEAAQIDPGTVMVIDEEGALQQSRQAYDKRVAGVVSGAGDLRPGIVLDKQKSLGNRLPIALLGKVYCKVDAQYGSVDVGDLLTTSPTPGFAMKADSPLKAFGAVIGKALRRLESGQGLIPVLVALQ
jgi:hypothetical protein